MGLEHAATIVEKHTRADEEARLRDIGHKRLGIVDVERKESATLG